MPIFHPNSLTKSVLEEKQQIFQAQDLQTLEKCALALELVGRLRKEGLDFIFKGGTSLMLLFDMPRRLSIDVDILCLEPLEKLAEVLERVVTEAPFNAWNHQGHRDREAPPTKHFQVYYEPIVPQGQDAAFWAARVGGRRLPENEEKLIFMRNGIRALRSHLFTEPFAPPQTRLAAGRATLVAEIVRKGATDFDLPGVLKAPLNVEYINGTQLEDPWVDLNTIKGTNTDAYALWEQAQRLRQQ